MISFFLKLSLATPPKHWVSGRHREVLALISGLVMRDDSINDDVEQSSTAHLRSVRGYR